MNFQYPATDKCPICGGPANSWWPSGNPEPCSTECELIELKTQGALYISPGNANIVAPGQN